MRKRIDKSSRSRGEHFRGRHRFEHWYVDNQVYFITARCRERVPALLLDEAKAIFLERFEHYTKKYDFIPWVTSVLDNHYHTLGYCTTGANLKEMMQRIHGSTAKLINDLNEAHGIDWSTHAARPASSGSRPSGPRPGRLVPFWRKTKGREYFDGCIRDEKQCRKAYRYTLTQSVRHGICEDWSEYPYTWVNVDLERGVLRAHELGAFLEGVPYKRYEG